MDRYQTPEMTEVWGERARNQIEREIWNEVMRLQADAGVPIPADAIAAYKDATERLADPIGGIEYAEELAIADIEREVKHDVYARLLYFNQQAGHEYAHWGMTSADVIENAQQTQLLMGVEVIGKHGEQVSLRLRELVSNEATRPMVARTHGRPAQVTTLGKRAADWAVELEYAMATLGAAADNYLPRGLKGAVGTRADMAALLHRHNPDAHPLALAETLDSQLADNVLVSTGQCYPRGMDLPVVASLLQVAAACATVATNIRLMAALGHVYEMPADGQVGSSAMPHKANPRYSERVCGLLVVARGYASMLQDISGGTWFEGDVSTSSVRRVALPGLFHTVDAMLANTAYVLDRLQIDREAISADLRRWRPMLATGQLLEACVAAGVERSRAHELLRRHAELAGAVVGTLGSGVTFASRLADDPDIPLSYTEIEDVIARATDPGPPAWIALGYAGRPTDDVLAVGRDESWPGELL